MPDPKAVLFATASYLKAHPAEIFRTLRDMRHLRLGVPLAAIRWLAREFLRSPGGPQDVEISSAEPGIRIEATVEQMGTSLRGSCEIHVTKVTAAPSELLIDLRLKNVNVRLLDETVQTPLAALIRSGTLDLSRVASLVAYMPSRPPMLIEAADDRVVLDLMKLPQAASDSRIQSFIGLAAKIAAVESIRVVEDRLEVAFRAFPGGHNEIVR